MTKGTIAVLAFLVLGVAGIFFLYSGGRETNQLGEETLKTEETLSNLPTSAPIADANNMNDTQVTELKIEDEKVGTGTEAVDGKTVSVNYKGTLLNGTQFDSSYDRGTPFEFQLGSGMVIEGWDKGLVGMKVGGKRKLTIPANMAYGSQAVGTIPADSPLIFEVELLEVK